MPAIKAMEEGQARAGSYWRRSKKMCDKKPTNLVTISVKEKLRIKFQAGEIRLREIKLTEK